MMKTMKINSLVKLGAISTLILGTTNCSISANTTSNSDPETVANNSQQEQTQSNSLEIASDTFFCGNINGRPTIMARHHWGNIPVIGFQSEAFTSDGWSPQKRCEDISERLEEFHVKGWLNHLTQEDMRIDGKLIPVICISEKERPHFTLPRGQVGLLMTLTQQDDGEEILATLKGIGKNFGEGALIH